MTRFSSGKEVKAINKELRDFLVTQLKTTDLKLLISLVNKYLGYSLSKSESIYLYFQLITRRTAISVESEKIFVDHFQLWPELKVLAYDYAHLINVPKKFKKDSYLFYESFFISIKIKHCFSPVLNQNIEDITTSVKLKFPKEFQKALIFLSDSLAKENKFSNKQLNDIVANLVLFTHTLKNFYWDSDKNIAVLLEGNRFVVETIRSGMQRYLGRYYTLYYPDVITLSTDYFQNYDIDLIVTNYNEYLFNLDYGIPIILFEMMPSKRDWRHLLQKLDPHINYFI